LASPRFRDREPGRIVTEDVFFDSVGYAYRALSWLDIAKGRQNVCALQYAALDARQAIEHLLFEVLILSVGSALDGKEYAKCRGNSTKLSKFIRRLQPHYNKLVEFNKAIVSTDPSAPPIIGWDLSVLMKHWGMLSGYLHWTGGPADTVESERWFNEGVQVIEAAAAFLWDNHQRGFTAMVRPDRMEPSVRAIWERFRDDDLDIDGVKVSLQLAVPVLKLRSRP